ncbi:MAG: hypothetical protein H0W86_06685 [Armatimonadetes bacterium]|nr:hypothetical protein [Armatimonadota bacterium]
MASEAGIGIQAAAERSSVIDNRGDNTLQVAIENITQSGRELCAATAFFSLDALAMIAKNLHTVDRVRILFGDDASRTQRAILLQRLRQRSDSDFADQRLIDPELDALKKVNELFKQAGSKPAAIRSRSFMRKPTFRRGKTIHRKWGFSDPVTSHGPASLKTSN